MSGRIVLELALLVALVLANGAFALAEMAFVSARRARLAPLAARGDKRAAAALALMATPERFLSTTQVGITLIGILAGAYGGATLAEELGAALERWPPLAGRGESVAFGVIVLGLWFLSLVLGELVPKRIALAFPEAIVRRAAAPMAFLARLATPAVWGLTLATRFVTRLLGLRSSVRSPVTEEEIRTLLVEAAEGGVVAPGERQIMERALRLGDLEVAELMTPRHEIAWLDLDAPPAAQLGKLAASAHARLPVARGELDRVEGVVRVRHPLAAAALAGGAVPPLADYVVRPTFVPETLGALAAVARLGEAPGRMLLVVDEHGALQGLLTEADLVGGLAADLAPGLAAEPGVVIQPDGSLLVDGLLPLVDLKRRLDVDELPGEERGAFRTAAGFALARLGELPTTGASFDWNGWHFEVAAVDGRRIDRLRLVPPPTVEEET